MRYVLNAHTRHGIGPGWAVTTLMCISIGIPKNISFPFVPNGKLVVFRCPIIKAHQGISKRGVLVQSNCGGT